MMDEASGLSHSRSPTRVDYRQEIMILRHASNGRTNMSGEVGDAEEGNAYFSCKLNHQLALVSGT